MKVQTGTRGKRKIRVGRVVSNRMDKSIIVKVERTFRHPFYQKVVRKATTFKAHDEKNEAQERDMVEIMETKPRSKTKRWRLIRVIKPGAETEREKSETDSMINEEIRSFDFAQDKNPESESVPNSQLSI